MRDVGFTPRYRLEQGIRDTVAWWKEQWKAEPRMQA
jgi:nucleoside-diphosphate-sugar epimerase